MCEMSVTCLNCKQECVPENETYCVTTDTASVLKFICPGCGFEVSLSATATS